LHIKAQIYPNTIIGSAFNTSQAAHPEKIINKKISELNDTVDQIGSTDIY
jgi:hypothetical protein